MAKTSRNVDSWKWFNVHFKHTVLLIGLFKTVTSEMMIILFLKTCGAAKFSGWLRKMRYLQESCFRKEKKRKSGERSLRNKFNLLIVWKFEKSIEIHSTEFSYPRNVALEILAPIQDLALAFLFFLMILIDDSNSLCIHTKGLRWFDDASISCRYLKLYVGLLHSPRRRGATSSSES